MIRILIAEDQNMVLGALAALLSLESDLDIVAQATDGSKALALARLHQPDVVLTDIEMPIMSGLDLALAIRDEFKAMRVLILTTFARPGYLRKALEAGVAGYMLKDGPSDKLADAIRRINQGLRVIDPELALDAWEGGNPLNDRERQVLSLAGEGYRNQEIAQQLHLAEGTVRNYLSDALGKLDARNRVEAYRKARDQGWL